MIKHYNLTVFQARNRVACGIASYFSLSAYMHYAYAVQKDGRVTEYRNLQMVVDELNLNTDYFCGNDWCLVHQLKANLWPSTID